MQYELVFVERRPQLIEQFEAAADRAGERWLPRLGVVGPARLGLLQRDIGVAHRLVFALMRLGGDDEADIGREADALLADDDRADRELQEPAGKGFGVDEAGGRVAEDDSELVGAEPRHHIGALHRRMAAELRLRRLTRPGSGKQPVGDHPQHRIARAGAIKVIDPFEIVDVE